MVAQFLRFAKRRHEELVSSAQPTGRGYLAKAWLQEQLPVYLALQEHTKWNLNDFAAKATVLSASICDSSIFGLVIDTAVKPDTSVALHNPFGNDGWMYVLLGDSVVSVVPVEFKASVGGTELKDNRMSVLSHPEDRTPTWAVILGIRVFTTKKTIDGVIKAIVNGFFIAGCERRLSRVLALRGTTSAKSFNVACAPGTQSQHFAPGSKGPPGITGKGAPWSAVRFFKGKAALKHPAMTSLMKRFRSRGLPVRDFYGDSFVHASFA